jgi:hypothetical protein
MAYRHTLNECVNFATNEKEIDLANLCKDKKKLIEARID